MVAHIMVLCRGRRSPYVWLEWPYGGIGATWAESVFSSQPEVGPLSSVLRSRSLPLPPLPPAPTHAPLFPRSGWSWPTGPSRESRASGRPALPLATIEPLLALPRPAEAVNGAPIGRPGQPGQSEARLQGGG